MTNILLCSKYFIYPPILVLICVFAVNADFQDAKILDEAAVKLSRLGVVFIHFDNNGPHVLVKGQKIDAGNILIVRDIAVEVQKDDKYLDKMNDLVQSLTNNKLKIKEEKSHIVFEEAPRGDKVYNIYVVDDEEYKLLQHLDTKSQYEVFAWVPLKDLSKPGNTGHKIEIGSKKYELKSEDFFANKFLSNRDFQKKIESLN